MAVRELPKELIRIILSKLPVKSLLRFKCVSKSWYAIIKSRHFIDLHLENRSSVRSKYDYLIVSRFHEYRHVLSFYCYETLGDLGIDIDIDAPFSEWEGRVIVSGPCNGVLCMTDNRQIVICNPSIREFRSLVVPPLVCPDKVVHRIDAVAFGFDPNTGDYKVVKIGLHHYFSEPKSYKVEVYNFSTDSWREAGVIVPNRISYPGYAFLLNGAFHWHLKCSPHVVDEILSFQISNEVTQLIPLPDFCSWSDARLRDLSVWNESLALIVYDRDLMERRYEIWVMTEYGVRESWIRIFNLGPMLGIRSPLAFWKNDELLFETDKGQLQLVSCNLRHQKLKHFPIYGERTFLRTPPFTGDLSSFAVFPYSESLVSVNAINEKRGPA